MSAAEAGRVQATFAATLVDEWARSGIVHAVVCPGSRSAPLALALAADDRVRVHVRLDERSAAFVALGIGKATGVPAVAVTTSGTAAVEMHAAVVEAAYARVPMIVATADRPPELQGVGAPQSIDQAHLYGRSARWFAQPGPAEAATAPTWRSTASRVVAEALGPPAGPVHLNLAFREPLVADPGPLPPGRAGGEPWHRRSPTVAALEGRPGDSVELVAGRRGVIVAGAGTSDPSAVHHLASALGWPVLADPLSSARLPGPATVAAFDAILRHQLFAEAHWPEVVVRFGALPASRVVSEWLAAAQAVEILVDPHGEWLDPGRSAGVTVAADATSWCRAVVGAAPTPAEPEWARGWADAEDRAQQAIERTLAGQVGLTEPAVARTVAAAVAPGTTVVVSSSMPVRDVEWYAAPRGELRVLANRGANGIDGVVATAAGVALGSEGPITLLVGDLAFLYDVNGLLGLAGTELDLTIVVVDNDGGGIFSLLPQAELVERHRFELLFGTPHGLDLVAVAEAHGVPATLVSDVAALEAALTQAPGQPRVLVVRTERQANAALHRKINAAVTAALTHR